MKELLYLKDQQLKELIVKLFVGYRETFSDSKKILDKYSIGQLSIYLKFFLNLKMFRGIPQTILQLTLLTVGPLNIKVLSLWVSYIDIL